jgi:hypothetical protein
MSPEQKGENIGERRHVKLTRKEARCCQRGCGLAAHRHIRLCIAAGYQPQEEEVAKRANHGINRAAGGHGRDHYQHREAAEENQNWRFDMQPETGCMTFLSHKLQRDFFSKPRYNCTTRRQLMKTRNT